MKEEMQSLAALELCNSCNFFVGLTWKTTQSQQQLLTAQMLGHFTVQPNDQQQRRPVFSHKEQKYIFTVVYVYLVHKY